MAYSEQAKREIHRVRSSDPLKFLLEIYDKVSVVQLRVINDVKSLTFESNVFEACGFNVTLPKDLQKGAARTTLQVDNVSRDLVDYIESTNGAAGTTVRLIQLRRSDPTTAEFDLVIGLKNINITQQYVTGELAYDDLMNLPAVTLTHRPSTSPGLFT